MSGGRRECRGGRCCRHAAPLVRSVPRLLSLPLLLLLLCLAAAQSNALLTTLDARAWTDTQIVASLISPVPGETISQSLPLYNSETNTTLKGVYCVDKENEVAYVGSDVIHVYVMKKVSMNGTVITESGIDYDSETPGPSTAFYFAHDTALRLQGWATACVFVNQYEIYLPTISANNEAAGHTRFYTVIHRYLRRILRVSPVLSPTTDVQGSAATSARDAQPASSTCCGSSVVTERDSVAGVVPRVITPLSSGGVAIDDFQSWTITTQHVDFYPAATAPALALPASGQPTAGVALYILTTKPSTAAGAAAPSLVEGGDVVDSPDSGAAVSGSATWDVQGVLLPDPHQDNTVTFATTARTTERLAQCYASLIAQACPDCVPVALATSSLGVVIAFTSQTLNATYVTLLSTGTLCTSVGSVVGRDTGMQGAASPPDNYTVSVVESSYLKSTDSHATPQLVRLADAQLVQIAASVCNVSAMAVDDAGESRVYVGMTCHIAAPPTTTTTTAASASTASSTSSSTRGREMRLATVVLASATGNATVTVVRPTVLSAADKADGTEEIAALDVFSTTRLLHLTVRRRDGSTRVYTYAAFGVTSQRPNMVDSYGGTPVRLTGYGLVAGMECVFRGSGDAKAPLVTVDLTGIFCVAPPLSLSVCTPHLLSIRFAYTVAWAIPSAQPHHSVISPTNTFIRYLTSPVARTAEVYMPIQPNVTTNITVNGFWFVNGTEYGLDTKCLYEQFAANCESRVIGNAVFLTDTKVVCVFEGRLPSSVSSSVRLSMDGYTFSKTEALFVMHSTREGLSVMVQSQGDGDSDSSEGSSVVVSDFVAEVRAERYTRVNNILVFLVNSLGEQLPLPEGLGKLYALLTCEYYTTDAGSISGGGSGSSSNSPDSAVPIRPSSWPLTVNGTLMQPLDETGTAVFDDIVFECPPIGLWTFEIYVTNGTHILTDYFSGTMEVFVHEGAPYAPVFVAMPSTSYYPETVLLTEQPVVGVQDSCGNVYTYLNDSVFVGPLTVQLLLELVETNATTGEENVVGLYDYGDSWMLWAPLNNLFYITNVSFPTQVFDTRFFISVTADLPVSNIISPPIKARPCEPDRQSVLTSSLVTDDIMVLVLRDLECGPCPTHSICDGTVNVRARDGYWRVNATSNVFTSCRVAYGMSEACVNDSQCSPGYQGVLCGECADGYHTLGRACHPCLARGLQGFLFALVMVVMVLVMALFVVLLTLIPPASLLVLSVRSLLLAVQVTSLFMFIAVPWPARLGRLFNGLYATAQLMETMATCFLTPSGFLILLACAPLIIVAVVTVIAAAAVRLLKVHRADAHRVSAVVLMALLHRKQERFHHLRHLIAQEMAEQASVLSNRRAASLNGLEVVAPHSDSISASATRLSMSAEWAALQRGAGRTARPSIRSSRGTTASASAAQAASSVHKSVGGPEGAVVDAFAAETAAVMARLARTVPPCTESPTWEQFVVSALQGCNGDVLKAAERVRLPLLTREEVREWAAVTVDVTAAPAPHKRRRGDGRRGEESLSPSARSGASAHGGSATQRRYSHSGRDASAGHASNDSTDAKSSGVDQGGAANDGVTAAAAAVFENSHTRPASSVLWKRVGMMAAYREMAVFQFRGSWQALLMSTAALVFVVFYLPLMLHAVLWMRCVTLPFVVNETAGALNVSLASPTLACSSEQNRAMRGLAIAMVVVYGCGAPLALVALSFFLRRRYGVDVMYAALPVIYFGDSTLDFLVSVSYMLTKLIAVIAVTQTRAPMMQMSVLSVLFALTIFLNTMWGGTGESVVMRTRFVTVTRRSVLTVSRLLFLLVCEVLLLLVYLIVSGYALSASGESGFVAIVSCGIGAVFALFITVTVHEFVSHVRYAFDYRHIKAAREHEQRKLLEILLRRYVDISATIELYLKVCDRGLAVAQQLDTLSRIPHVGCDDTASTAGGAAAAADENMLSFLSVTGMEHHPHTRSPTPEKERAKLKPPLPRSASAGAAHPGAAAAAAAASSDGGDSGGGGVPEALTHFSPYPELTSRDFLSPAPSAGTNTSSKASKRHRQERRGTAPCLSAAFRSSANPHATAVNAPGLASSASSSLLEPLASGEQRLPGSPLQLQQQQQDQQLFLLGAGGSDLVASPVEGNPYWVSAPRPAASAAAPATTTAAAAGGAAVADAPPGETGAAPAVVTGPQWGASPPSPGSAASMGGSLPGVAAAATHGKATAVAGAETAAGEHQSSGTEQLDAAAAAALATVAAVATARVAEEVHSGDYTEVQQPAPQPLLRRSDSLLLSIRGLEPEYTAKLQTSRTALVDESRAVATADYQRAVRERQQQQHRGISGRPTSRSGEHTDASAGAAGKGKGESSAAAAAAAVSALLPGDASCPPSQNAEPVVTIESLLPVADLDLASSFDPLAVPPLPLTRALTKLRGTPSSSPAPGSGAGTTATRKAQGRGRTESLLAALQEDLEAELEQLHAMPLRDSVLGMDLAQLASAQSQLLNNISFWGGAAARELVDGSTPPPSMAARSRIGHASQGRASAVGAASGTTRPASQSQLHPHADPVAAPPSGSSPQSRTGSEGHGGAAPQRSTTAATHRDEATAPAAMAFNSDMGTASLSGYVPPLPTFPVPQVRAHTSHHTAAEYMRRRSARTNRTPRSRSSGQAVSRSRAKGSTAATPRPPENAKVQYAPERKPKAE